jgi:hypothetical protein
MTLTELVPMLQLAVGPVILVSGIGLLLLAMTNRFGHVVDRSRDLSVAIRGGGPDAGALRAQLDILARRAELIRRAIFLATLSLLLAAVLVIALFIASLLGLEAGVLVAVLFIACMLALIVSLVSFLRDINLSLDAFTLERDAARSPGAPRH